MRITFGRSGGIVAAPGLTIKASLNLSGGGARVTDTASGYVRDLSAEDGQKVRARIDTTSFFRLPRELRSLNESTTRSGRSSIADQRQYDITVHSDDGLEHSVTASETMADELERLSPGLGQFLSWISEESDRIIRYRMQHE